MGLSHHVQQDTQEFSQLFAALIEGQLSEQGGSSAISREFGGASEYQTTSVCEYSPHLLKRGCRCNACGAVTRSEASFLQLDLAAKDRTSLLVQVLPGARALIFAHRTASTTCLRRSCSTVTTSTFAKRAAASETRSGSSGLRRPRACSVSRCCGSCALPALTPIDSNERRSYDRKSGNKKKLGHVFRFPARLDLRSFTDQPAQGPILRKAFCVDVC